MTGQKKAQQPWARQTSRSQRPKLLGQRRSGGILKAVFEDSEGGNLYDWHCSSHEATRACPTLGMSACLCQTLRLRQAVHTLSCALEHCSLMLPRSDAQIGVTMPKCLRQLLLSELDRSGCNCAVSLLHAAVCQHWRMATTANGEARPESQQEVE